MVLERTAICSMQKHAGEARLACQASSNPMSDHFQKAVAEPSSVTEKVCLAKQSSLRSKPLHRHTLRIFASTLMTKRGRPIQSLTISNLALAAKSFYLKDFRSMTRFTVLIGGLRFHHHLSMLPISCPCLSLRLPINKAQQVGAS